MHHCVAAEDRSWISSFCRGGGGGGCRIDDALVRGAVPLVVDPDDRLCAVRGGPRTFLAQLWPAFQSRVSLCSRMRDHARFGVYCSHRRRLHCGRAMKGTFDVEELPGIRSDEGNIQELSWTLLLVGFPGVPRVE